VPIRSDTGRPVENQVLQLIDFHALGAKALGQVHSRMYLELDFTPVVCQNSARP
jgi:hypothetical protein